MIKRVFPIIYLSTLILYFLPPTLAATLPTFYIEPATQTAYEIGQTLTVNVKIADVANLYSWGFILDYNSRIINATSHAQGPFLKSGGSTIYIPVKWNEPINATHSRVYLSCSLTGENPGVSGSGTLATINFTAKGGGISPLHLNYTKLYKMNFTPLPEPEEIPQNPPIDGEIHVEVSDIAVTGIQLSKTITNDTTINIYVTVENLGVTTATFNVTVYYDSIPIETKPVTDLPPAANTTLTFTFDTTPVSKGTYNIKAIADPILGETYTDNNTLIDGSIIETIEGDATGDGHVNILDAGVLASAFGSELGEPRYNPNADLYEDGMINILDAAKVAAHFGE